MATFTVTNLKDSGQGSLRAAIEAANTAGSPAVVAFDVAGTIALASDLPPISNQIKLDATSAPTYASGGPPVVELDCNGHAGLVFGTGSDGSQLLGFSVCNAAGNGVTLNAGSITLDANYIGLDPAGAAFGNTGDGVYVSSSSSNNLIGLNTSGASGGVANVISGNTENGISFHGSSGNAVVANRIGTDPSGTSAIANGGNGIWLTAGSHGNEIGGTAYIDSSTGQANDPTGDKGTVTPAFVVPPLGNLVSGNGASGILIDAHSRNNVLNGNFIGTTADGNSALGNAADGVWINGANDNSLIGCQVVNNPFVYYNVVSGNGGNGLHVTNSDNVTVQGNFFGIGANNTNLVGNRLDGILIDGSSKNTQVGGVIPLGNVASGNGANGIEVRDTASGFTTFNTFGGLLAFKGAAPNGNDGLLITSTGGNQTVRTNVFSGNANNGIEIAGDAAGVTVDPNIVGLNTVGNAVLPNGNNGLQIGGIAHDNVVGGYLSSVIPQNTFSGNDGYGVAILGQAHDNQLFNSFVGLNSTGTTALGNLAGGILVAGSANNDTIGGISSDPSMPKTNLISGNAGNGVTLTTGTTSIQVVDNGIGLDRFGLPSLPNSGVPIDANGSAYVVAVPNGAQTVFAAGSGTIAGGTGSNLQVLGSGSNIVANIGSDTILGGTGAATVFAGKSDLLFGSTGSLLFVGDGAGSSSTVVGGSGNETLFGGAGGASGLFFVDSRSFLLNAQDANDTVVAGAGAGSAALFADNGGTVTLFSQTPGNVLVAGAGNVTLNAGGGTAGNSLWAGTGADSLVGGSGPDVFAFVNGGAGGADAIANWTEKDTLALIGYGPNGITGQGTDQFGNAVITLSDGTRITVEGVGSVPSTHIFLS